MKLLASSAAPSWPVLIASLLSVVLLAAFGIVVILDWHEVGSRYFRRLTKDLLGGWWAKRGYGTFKFFAGWCAAVMGLIGTAGIIGLLVHSL